MNEQKTYFLKRKSYELDGTVKLVPCLDITETYFTDQNNKKITLAVSYAVHSEVGSGLRLLFTVVEESGNDPIKELFDFQNEGVWERMGFFLSN